VVVGWGDRAGQGDVLQGCVHGEGPDLAAQPRSRQSEADQGGLAPKGRSGLVWYGVVWWGVV